MSCHPPSASLHSLILGVVGGEHYHTPKIGGIHLKRLLIVVCIVLIHRNKEILALCPQLECSEVIGFVGGDFGGLQFCAIVGTP